MGLKFTRNKKKFFTLMNPCMETEVAEKKH